MIGVNRYIDDEEVLDIETAPLRSARRRSGRSPALSAFARERDDAKVTRCSTSSSRWRKDDRQNIMPVTIELVADGATMGEIVERLKKLWGTYRETPVF